MTPIDMLLARLPGAKQATGKREWRAPCPAHDDKHPSLSVGESSDGTCLVRCHAGCTAESIVSAVGLNMRDLFPPNGNGNGYKPSTFPSAAAAVQWLETKHGKRSAWWTYQDLQREPIGVIVRWDGPNGKDIRPVSRNGQGWFVGAMQTPRPLYRLSELLALTGTVYVVEGEKAADAAAALGLVATTSAGGSQAPHLTDWSCLAGRGVVLLPDNDEPGRQYVAEIVSILIGLSPPAKVRIVALPELPDGGDIVDFVAARRAASKDDADIRGEIEDLAAAAPIMTPESAAAAKAPAAIIHTVADIEGREVAWLWPRWIPRGTLSLLDGDPGLGKSTIAFDLAARASRGWEMPPAAGPCQGAEPEHVLLLSAEDDPARTIRPRLEAAGADLTRVHILEAVHAAEGTRPPVLPWDIDTLAGIVHEREIALLIVDPIMAYLSAGVDSHKDQDIRTCLYRLKTLAETTGAAILLIRHLNKMNHSVALYRGGGSIGIIGAARSGMVVGKHPDAPDTFVLASNKSNLGPRPRSLTYSLVPSGGVAKIGWGGECDLTADEVVAHAPPGKKTVAEKCAADLAGLLGDGIWHPTKDVEAKLSGLGHSVRAIREARKILGVLQDKEAFSGRWVLRLPPDEDAQDG